MAGRTRKSLLILFLIGTFLASAGLSIEKVPNPKTTRNSFVTDGAGVLSPTYRQWIESLTNSLESATGAELAVVTVDNLDNLTVEEYAVRLFNLWGIGKKEKDNGILLLFSLYDRKVRIEVGYGLEPVLTDALSKRIIYSDGIPYFKQEQYAQGIYRMALSIADTVSRAEGKDLGITLPQTWPSQVKAKPKPPPKDIMGMKISSPWLAAGALPGLVLILVTLLFFYKLGRFFITPAKAGKERVLAGFGTPLILMWALGLVGAFIWGGIFDTLGRSLLVALASASGFSFLVEGVKKSRTRWLKHYHLPCPECSRPMKLYDEVADDAFLLPEEIAEEKVGGMDYEFWHCDSCNLKERFEVKLPWASACPECGRRSLLRTSQVLQEATRNASGTMKIIKRCHNPKCKYLKEYTRTIPKIPPPSSSSSSGSSWSSSSSSGSFGGGSSGGGGASGGW